MMTRAEATAIVQEAVDAAEAAQYLGMPVGGALLRETPMDHWPEAAKVAFSHSINVGLEGKARAARLDLFKPWSTLEGLIEMLMGEGEER
jgi:hypothetical protein